MKALLMAFSMYSRLPVPDLSGRRRTGKGHVLLSSGWGPGRGCIFLVYLLWNGQGQGLFLKGRF